MASNPKRAVRADHKDPANLVIVYRDPNTLKADPRNARTHSPEQVEQIRKSIREFGFTNPILLRDETNIGAGHGRQLGAIAEGLGSVPTITLPGLTPAQWRAYAIADNKIALNAGWDENMLRLELGELNGMDFDMALTGFSTGEIASIMVDKTVGLTDPDDAPELPANPVTRPGDVWLLGATVTCPMCGKTTPAGRKG